ncbi:hypothetical protein OY671_012818, partial [Metschnikowia pulcherrima]
PARAGAARPLQCRIRWHRRPVRSAGAAQSHGGGRTALLRQPVVADRRSGATRSNGRPGPPRPVLAPFQRPLHGGACRRATGRVATDADACAGDGRNPFSCAAGRSADRRGAAATGGEGAKPCRDRRPPGLFQRIGVQHSVPASSWH